MGRLIETLSRLPSAKLGQAPLSNIHGAARMPCKQSSVEISVFSSDTFVHPFDERDVMSSFSKKYTWMQAMTRAIMNEKQLAMLGFKQYMYI